VSTVWIGINVENDEIKLKGLASTSFSKYGKERFHLLKTAFSFLIPKQRQIRC